MITAEEARHRVRAINWIAIIRPEKELVELIIKDAIKAGLKSCWLGFRASDETIAWLKSFGYIVKIERLSRPEDQADTRVLW